MYLADALGIVAFDPRGSTKKRSSRRRFGGSVRRNHYVNNNKMTKVAVKVLKGILIFQFLFSLLFFAFDIAFVFTDCWFCIYVVGVFSLVFLGLLLLIRLICCFLPLLFNLLFSAISAIRCNFALFVVTILSYCMMSSLLLLLFYCRCCHHCITSINAEIFIFQRIVVKLNTRTCCQS